MSQPFLAEIRMFGGNFAPSGWAECDGQIMAISQNTALFSILGTSFGGNGTSNFGLPNLQAAAPMNQGQGPGLTPRIIGQTGGEPAVTLVQTQLASHSHSLDATSNPGAQESPAGNV